MLRLLRPFRPRNDHFLIDPSTTLRFAQDDKVGRRNSLSPNYGSSLIGAGQAAWVGLEGQVLGGFKESFGDWGDVFEAGQFGLSSSVKDCSNRYGAEAGHTQKSELRGGIDIYGEAFGMIGSPDLFWVV